MRLAFFVSLFLITQAQAGTRIEQSFKDPITGKSGLYTASFSTSKTESKQALKSKPEGLLLFFHGSGNTQGYASVFPILEKAAQAHQLLPMALQAPNQAVTWPEGPHAPNNRHVDYVKSFLEREIHAKHPEIRRDRLILVGYSAGATFLSGDFLPAALRLYQGGAVMLCGGGGPVRFPPDVFETFSAEIARRFPLYFLIQKKDFLYAQTRQGIDYWQARKALVHAETPDGGGHCAFDFATELSRGLRKIFEISSPAAR